MDADGQLVDSIEAQTAQALANIRALVEEAGGRIEDVVATRVYLARREDFAAMNAVYARTFAAQPPARTTVAVTHITRSASSRSRPSPCSVNLDFSSTDP